MRRNVPCRLCVAAFLLLLAAIVGAVVVRADEDAAAASRSRQELQPGSDERNQGVDSVAALQSDQSGDSEWDGADSDSPLDSGDVVGELVDEDEEDKDEEDEDDDDYASIDYRSILASAAENLTEAARRATNAMSESVSARLEVLFRQANSSECRASIAEHLGYFVQSVGGEKSMPFAEWQMESECPEPSLDWDHLPEGMHIGHLQNKSYQPEDGEYKNATDLRLLYGILTHDDAAATVRLLTVLNDTNVKFVVHVDGKHVETQDALLRFALAHGNVHILPDDRRVRINWGGFTMVNATLQLLQYALLETSLAHHALSDFDKFVHLASTSYPLASNREIKERLAQFPIDANLLYAVMKPARPKPWGWHYFVECDDRLHRIHRLSPWQNSTHGVDLYTSSQWFMLSREFALHLAAPPPGSFVDLFLQYARHVVVADETFFGTALLHSPYCAKHHNANFLHLQFDRWESVLPQDKRDPKKCMMLDPNHCGRSPTVMTIDNVDLLELSPDLFARKFVDSVDDRVKDIVDVWRKRRNDDDTYQARTVRNVEFEGHGALIVAKDTVHDEDPLCLGLGETGNAVRLVPCFYEEVLPTLAKDWATGAVILDEVAPHNRWEVGPCTSDGHVERLNTAEMNSTPGIYSVTGPRCLLKQMDGIRLGRCLDVDSRSLQPGGATQVFPCINKWYQFVSFGDGTVAPKGSIYSTIPSHIVKQIENLGHDHIPYMCLGVYGRGVNDEYDWEEEEDDLEKNGTKQHDDTERPAWAPLSKFLEQNIIATQCSNVGAVIEWLFVPFIVENESADAMSDNIAQNDSTVGGMDLVSSQSSLTDLSNGEGGASFDASNDRSRRSEPLSDRLATVEEHEWRDPSSTEDGTEEL